MNKQIFMDRLVDLLGLPALSMEKYYPKIDKIITTDTMTTFSQYFPYTYEFKMDLTKVPHEKGPGTWEKYYIKDEMLEAANLEIISVVNVVGASSMDQWNAPLQTFNVEGMILEAAASNVRSLLNISTKAFRFIPPNRVALKGFGGAETITMIVKIPYPNFGCISESVSVEFEKLALLDVKSRLYPELKLYTNLDTAEGTINLQIDDWANALEERTQLIETWRNKNFPLSAGYHPYNYE